MAVTCVDGKRKRATRRAAGLCGRGRGRRGGTGDGLAARKRNPRGAVRLLWASPAGGSRLPCQDGWAEG